MQFINYALILYPKMYYIGIPRHIQPIKAYMMLTVYFWELRSEIDLWECFLHPLLTVNFFVGAIMSNIMS